MISFFALVWTVLIVVLFLSPAIFTQTLGKVADDNNFAVEALFLIGLSALIAFLIVGVIRRWRWTFWLVLIAFFFGVLRVPTSALQIAGMIPASGPTWYEGLQGVIGAVQVLIAITMLAGYRKAGVWGAF